MHKKIYFSFFIIFLIFLLAIPVVFHKQFFKLDERIDDWKQVIALNLNKHGETELRDKIVIVSMDDMTPFELSQHPALNVKKWPLGRDTWSEVINFIEAGSPKTLSIAVPFQNYEDITLSANSSDLMFANTLRKYNNIVLGTVLTTPETISKNSLMTEVSDRIVNPYRPMRKSLDINLIKKDFPACINYYSYLPIPYIFLDSSVISFLNLPSGSDSVVRFSQPVSKVMTGSASYYMPSFAFATFLKYIGYEGKIDYKSNRISLGKYSIPLNNSAQHSITWRGTSRTYDFIPLSKIIIGMKTTGKSFRYNNIVYPREYFKDKIVIVAPTQTNLNTHNTSIEDGMTSAEIYANTIESYINDAKLDNPERIRFIKEIPLGSDIFIAAICATLLILNTVIFRTSLLSLFNSLLFIGMFLVWNIFLFSYPSIRINVSVVYPLYIMFVGLISAYFYVIFIENTKKRILTKIFGKFVSDSVLEKLHKNSKDFVLKIQNKEITVMCFDVTNFTEIVEKHSPVDVMEKLNAVFMTVTKKIFKYQGTLDKCTGSSIIAYWGDPIPTGNDALNAVKAAVEILEAVEIENADALDDEVKPEVMISINTGEALFGCVRTGKMARYIPLGDTVNITSRMQEICNHFKKKLLVSEKTYHQTDGFIKAEFSGNIKLKGKEEQIKLYAPILSKNDD